MDSNHRRQEPADLQSAPFGHSGNHPKLYFSKAIAKLMLLFRYNEQTPCFNFCLTLLALTSLYLMSLMLNGVSW